MGKQARRFLGEKGSDWLIFFFFYFFYLSWGEQDKNSIWGGGACVSVRATQKGNKQCFYTGQWARVASKTKEARSGAAAWGDILLLLLLHGCNYHTVAYDTREKVEGGGGEAVGWRRCVSRHGVEILCWTLKDDVCSEKPGRTPFRVVETRPALVRMDHGNEWIGYTAR